MKLKQNKKDPNSKRFSVSSIGLMLLKNLFRYIACIRYVQMFICSVDSQGNFGKNVVVALLPFSVINFYLLINFMKSVKRQQNQILTMLTLSWSCFRPVENGNGSGSGGDWPMDRSTMHLPSKFQWAGLFMSGRCFRSWYLIRRNNALSVSPIPSRCGRWRLIHFFFYYLSHKCEVNRTEER